MNFPHPQRNVILVFIAYALLSSVQIALFKKLGPQPAYAGQVRHLDLSEKIPARVKLCKGRGTVISFLVKPDHVAPGAPTQIHLEYVGKDLVVWPSGNSPGNLIVYTSYGR